MFDTLNQITALLGLNSLTPGSDRYVNSPCNLNRLSSRQVMRMKKIVNWGYCLDFTPNSQDQPTKKCMVLVRRINFQILGVKGLKILKKNYNIYITMS